MRYLARKKVTEKWRKTGAPGMTRTCDPKLRRDVVDAGGIQLS
jgi:hypothetical protein